MMTVQLEEHWTLRLGDEGKENPGKDLEEVQ